MEQYGGSIERVATTVTAAGTTTLVNTSPQIQVFTGTNTQTVVLPVATTYTKAGAKFEFYNNSTGAVTIQYQDFTVLQAIAPNTTLIVKCIDNGTANGTFTTLTNTAVPSGSANYVISSSSGAQAFQSTQNVITNLTVTITTLGGPVELSLQDDSSGNNSWLVIEGVPTGNQAYLHVNFMRDATQLTDMVAAGIQFNSNESNGSQFVAPSSCSFMDTPPAGTYTYTVQGYHSGASAATATINYVKLVAREIH